MATNTPADDKSVSKSCGRWAKRQRKRVTTRKFWLRHIPVIGFLLNDYNVGSLISDAIAGITIGLTFIPSSMASSVLAGLPPQYGLYSSIAAYFMYAILGSERCVVIGPTVLTAMLCRPFVDKFGMEVAFTLSFYSGLLVTALGLLNMGFVVHFISSPVLDGFLSAASLSAISSQIAPLLGFPGGGTTFVGYWINIVKGLQEYGPALWDSVLGFTCILALVGLQLLRPFGEIPKDKEVSMIEKISRTILKYIILGRTAIVVLITTIIVASLSKDGIPPVEVAGNITVGLPHFIVPPFTLVYNNETLGFVETLAELGTAITIPLIIIMESTAAAKAFALGQHIDAIQELIATGSVNVVGAFLQSMPCAASVTRTTINYNAGVRTPLGGFFAGSLVLIALGLFSTGLSYMPDASLAAVIITAVYFLLQIHNNTIHLWKTNNKSDLIPLWMTFLCCLLLGLDYGMIVGIVVNAMLLLNYAAKPKLDVQDLKIHDRRVLLVKPDRSVSYPGAELFRRTIVKPARVIGAGLLVVVDGKHVTKLDSTAVKSINAMMKELELHHQEIIFWNWRDYMESKFTLPIVFRTGEDLAQIIFNEFTNATKVQSTEVAAEDSDGESPNGANQALNHLP